MAGALAERLDKIKNKAKINLRDVAQLLDTTPETVSRWNTGKVDPQFNSLQKLLALEYVVEQLSEFYEPDEARLWLFSHHRLLEGKRPADLIHQGEIEPVLALIEQLRDGAFA